MVRMGPVPRNRPLGVVRHAARCRDVRPSSVGRASGLSWPIYSLPREGESTREDMPTRAGDETAAVRRRFVVLCTTLRGFANCAESYQRLHHYLPAPGSVAAREIEAGGSLATDTLSSAAMVLGGAHDHVIGLENLLAAQSSVYAPHTVARAVLEGAARAWWLLDPAIDGRERAGGVSPSGWRACMRPPRSSEPLRAGWAGHNRSHPSRRRPRPPPRSSRSQ